MATKKPSAAQLAARKLFAARAKAGTLGGGNGRKKTTLKKVVASTESKKNPLQRTIPKRGRIIEHFPWLVQTTDRQPLDEKQWKTFAGFKLKNDAEDHARQLHKIMPGLWIRVVDCD